MSAIGKAQKFLELCKENGWKGRYEFDHDNDYALVEVHRNGEKLKIEWIDNQLLEAPHYAVGAAEMRLHCASVARRRITAVKPDMDQVKRALRRARRKPAGTTVPVNNSDTPVLPFDINDPGVDGEVLKFCRGATLVWRNGITGEEEHEYIPRELNRDLVNTYFIKESSTGRPYLSFRNAEGIFRAVAFDQMLAIR